RRLSADRDRTARRRLRARRHATQWTGGKLPADPPTRTDLCRAECSSCDLLDLPTRSLHRGLLAHLLEACRFHLDGTRRCRTAFDSHPDHPAETQFLADHGKRHFTCARALRVLLYQWALACRNLQCRTLPRGEWCRTKSRLALSSMP